MAPPSASAMLAVLLAMHYTEAAVSQSTPLSKVIELLNEMHQKGVAEKEEEKKKYAAFKIWCNDQDRIKSNEVNTADEQIETLRATIMKAGSDIQQFSGRIAELQEDVGRWAKDKKSATAVRRRELADFKATVADHQESIDALEMAIKVLKKQAQDQAQADFAQVQSALLQVSRLHNVPKASKHKLVAFLQESQPDSDYKPPAAKGYQFQSGGVLDMLEQLRQEFITKKYELEKEELNNKHAYEKVVQQLTDNTENANHEISKKTTLTADAQEAKAQSEGDLKQTQDQQAEDQKYLDDTRGLCMHKAAAFESRSKLRQEELEVVQKTIDILSDGDVSGTAEKYLPSFVQKRSTHSLAQLRSNGQDPHQEQAAAYLSDQAKKSNSRLLSLVSQRVTSGPFVKVKKMIKDLIWKLMEEATAETEHKGWCDTELTTNKQTRETKTESVNKLTIEKEDLESAIEQLSQDIADLSAGVKELGEAMAKAYNDRADDQATNRQTMMESKAAQAAVSQAIGMLKDFYAKASDSTALVQQTPADDAPETFDHAYKGMVPESGNVVQFLEVILSDFIRLESETESTEAQQVEEFKKYMFESEKDKALKENAIEHKTGAKTNKESALHDTESELQVTQEQLDKAVAYYEKLKPTCVDSGITYEERVRRRQQEIESLQQALKILTSTDLS